jgi:hypothetical protein
LNTVEGVCWIIGSGFREGFGSLGSFTIGGKAKGFLGASLFGASVELVRALYEDDLFGGFFSCIFLPSFSNFYSFSSFRLAAYFASSLNFAKTLLYLNSFYSITFGARFF